VTEVGFQSILAWEVDKNVADVGWDPPTEIERGKPIVLFEPRGLWWQVSPIHAPGPACPRLATHTRFSWRLVPAELAVMA
jgi:hypothetical protein